jgi:L-ribulose-5-phosphate 3-epimerase UlaE
MGSSTFEGNEKIERIEKYTQDIYKRFMLRYGDIGNFKESEFRAKIIDCLNNQEVLDMLGSYIE